MGIELIELLQKSDLLYDGITCFRKCWRNQSNDKFYKNGIEDSANNKNTLPKSDLALTGKEMVGLYALLTNDLISR